MSPHHSHPYFTQLPTMRNRQDLAFALDRLPSMLAEYLHERQQSEKRRQHRTLQQEHQASQCTTFYPSPPPSPRSSAAVVTMMPVLGQTRGRSASVTSLSSSTSASSSSTYSSSSSSLFSSCSASSSNSFESRRRRRQHRLIEKNIVLSTDLLSQQQQQQQQQYAPILPFRLQFRNRAQAMAFLIQLLKTMQLSPEEQDEQHSQHQKFEQEPEQEQGLVPCYVCGEWYPKQIALYDQETGHFLRVVDGKSWHEQQPSAPGGASFTTSSSWQHWNAEQRVRAWLDQVVVVSVAAPAPAVLVVHAAEVGGGHTLPKVQAGQEEQDAHGADIKVSEKSTMTTTMTTTLLQETCISRRPASYMIPEEILDPSCRSPGFRIKEKTTAAPPAGSASATAIPSPPASPRSSLQFTFTSERFKTAVQEASVAKPIPAVMATNPAEETSVSDETEQEEKEKEQLTLNHETMVDEKMARWSRSDSKDASQPEAVSSTGPLQTSPVKDSKRGKGSWSFVRTTWRLTHRALIRPFAKPSNTSSAPLLSCA